MYCNNERTICWKKLWGLWISENCVTTANLIHKLQLKLLNFEHESACLSIDTLGREIFLSIFIFIYNSSCMMLFSFLLKSWFMVWRLISTSKELDRWHVEIIGLLFEKSFCTSDSLEYLEFRAWLRVILVKMICYEWYLLRVNFSYNNFSVWFYTFKYDFLTMKLEYSWTW